MKYLALILLIFTGSAGTAAARSWVILSPDQEQTFAYGTEQHRVWIKSDRNKTLILRLDYTNDPYVDRDNPREYDTFSFHFPGVALGKDQKTFYYQPVKGDAIPVAEIKPDFLGVDEIHLTPHAQVQVDLPHGEVSVRLIVFDRPIFADREAD